MRKGFLSRMQLGIFSRKSGDQEENKTSNQPSTIQPEKCVSQGVLSEEDRPQRKPTRAKSQHISVDSDHEEFTTFRNGPSQKFLSAKDTEPARELSGDVLSEGQASDTESYSSTPPSESSLSQAATPRKQKTVTWSKEDPKIHYYEQYSGYEENAPPSPRLRE